MTRNELLSVIHDVPGLLVRQGKPMALEERDGVFRFTRADEGHTDVRFHSSSKDDAALIEFKASTEPEDFWVLQEVETVPGLAEQVWDYSDPDHTAYRF